VVRGWGMVRMVVFVIAKVWQCLHVSNYVG